MCVMETIVCTRKLERYRNQSVNLAGSRLEYSWLVGGVSPTGIRETNRSTTGSMSTRLSDYNRKHPCLIGTSECYINGTRQNPEVMLSTHEIQENK